MTDVQLYGFVQDGAVTDGPRILPPSWRTDDVEILAFDRLDDPTSYGWWPWVEESAPDFDPAKQRIEPLVGLDIGAKRIVRSYSVVNLTMEEIAAANPVPDSVFDYQFAGEAEARGFITRAECDAWVGPGVIPQSLLDAVSQIIPDEEARRPVVLFLKGSKEFPRYHQNTMALAPLFGLDTEDKIDAFFIAASKR